MEHITLPTLKVAPQGHLYGSVPLRMPYEKHALVAFGSNLALGKVLPAALIRQAIFDLTDLGFNILRLSKFYSTPCFPAGAGPDYVNAACVLRHNKDVSPDIVLNALHDVENRHGRRRESRWAGRTLDLDLLAFGDVVAPDRQVQRHWMDLPIAVQAQTAPETLILPHPRLQERAFVLVPLADVAPDWVHPVLQRSVLQMLEDLPAQDRKQVVEIA
jgi:2-amino-4-hydroxy-6-hydroxymethyldihydropteridine diphosphokinase